MLLLGKDTKLLINFIVLDSIKSEKYDEELESWYWT